MITMMSSLILGMIVLSNIFFSAENFLQLLIKVAIYLTVIPIFYYLGTNALKVEYIDKIAGLLWKK